MAHADVVFKGICEMIINTGISDEAFEVRPRWEDGEPAHTIKKFSMVSRYDLRKEFPILTLRPTNLRAAVDEVLWIYQKQSNNIHDLHSHIWDQWADKDGSIGKAYGYQVGLEFPHKRYTYYGTQLLEMERNGETPEGMDENTFINVLTAIKDNIADISMQYANGYITMDEMGSKINAIKIEHTARANQIDHVLYELKHNPFSRRMVINLWNNEDLLDMALTPCCWSLLFDVMPGYDGKLVLNMMLNQRSNDVLVANNWNVVQYAALLMMIAQSVDMAPGILTHVITNAHIYDRHVDIIKELIQRQPYPAPIVTLNPEKKNFYEFTPDDFTIAGYQHGDPIKNIPVAI